MKPPLWTPFRAAVLALTLGYLVFWTYLAWEARVRGEPLVAAAIPVGIGILVLVLDVAAGRSTNGLLRAFLGTANVWLYKVFDEAQPSYRYVDFFLAARRYADLAKNARVIENHHPQQSLQQVLRTLHVGASPTAPQNKTCIGYERNGFFAADAFWLLEGPAGLGPTDRIVIRVSNGYQGAKVEVAARSVEQASVVLQWLNRDALAHSIFRGQFLEIRYTRPAHADYDYYHVTNELTILFKGKPNVGEADIILDDRVRAVLRRTVFDFFEHRDRLHGYGLPLKRALLFYGPPGTGKTHTCRHIHTRLAGVTSILVTGNALVRLQDIGQFARQLHPCLVVIEDVDLVFTARDVNPYGTALGELMDQLDGFTPDEEVVFLLTTNAIERVEEAIRDRPGRINQCLHFGLPSPELRRLFLDQYLRPYDVSAVDMDHLVKQTDHTSQAFLKEYVHRAVQVAAEAAGYEPRPALALQTAHFDTAFDELTSHGDPHGHAIMGFRLGKR
jgi:hypothetical protein